MTRRPVESIGQREKVHSNVVYDRGVGVICFAGIACTHLTDLPENIEGAPCMAVMFCGLIVAAAGLGILLACGRRSTVM